MRVGILAHEFLINIGANDFLRNLLRALVLEADTELFFLCPQADRIRTQADLRSEYQFYIESAPNMTIVPSNQSDQAYQLIKDSFNIDVFFPTIHPLANDLRYVTYWPDCQPKHFPEFFDDESQAARDRMITQLLETTRPMIINSRDAKSDLIRFYSANPSQIYDLPFAPIADFDVFVPRPELMTEFGLPSEYFIVSNQMWVHKSVETVLQAVATLKLRGNSRFVVFTGRMDEPRRPEYIQHVRSMASLLGIENEVRFLGYVPKRVQIELLKNSIAVIQPTLFEGGPGGGSVYDAQSMGVRCIVTDIAVNHELPKNNLITYFPPRDFIRLADLMDFVARTPYVAPPVEDLYRQSLEAKRRLSKRLYRALIAAASS